jgi:carbonic anhydrase
MFPFSVIDRPAARQVTLGVAVVVLGIGAGANLLAQERPRISNPAEAVKVLKDGNARFERGEPHVRDLIQKRKEGIEGQQPFAIVLACADSRVPPEFVFDQTLGKLFTVRVAGNVIDPVALGSMEYAVETFGSKLLIVLGHESCGAVSAAVKGGQFPPNIEAIVRRIAPAVAHARAGGKKGSALVEAAAEDNVREQMQQLQKESPLLAGAVKQGKLQLLGGVCDLETGAVRWVTPAGAAP